MSGRSRHLLLALTLAIANCGGAPPSAPTPPTQTPGAAPVAALQLTIDSLGSQEAVAAVSEITVDASTSSGTELRYQIDFGDGSVSSDRLARHVYAAAGTYHVALIVTDTRDRTAAASRDVVVGSPLGLWVHSAYFPRVNRVEARALAIAAQDGAVIRGILTKDGTSRMPFSGAITPDRRVRIALEGTAEGLEGVIPSVLTADGATWALSLRGGVLDGESSAFTRVLDQPTGPAPDADLRMRFISFGAPFAVRQITPVLFDGSNSRGDRLTFYIEFGDGQVATAATTTHPIDKVGEYTARLTVVDRFGRPSSESAQYRVLELTDRTNASYWRGSSDTCRCAGSLEFATQQGTRVTGSHSVKPQQGGEFSLSTFAGTVSATGEVQLTLTGTDVTLTGVLSLPGQSIYSLQNQLTLTYRGGPFDGGTIVLHPYSSY